MYLIAGLGNPEAKFDNTRHNIGFTVVNHVAAESNVNWTPFPNLESQIAPIQYKGKSAILAKPQTYMNASGDALRKLIKFYRMPLDRVIVVYDDFGLQLGRIKIQVGGGTNGHNGVSHITDELSSNSFCKLKCGIGPAPKGKSRVDFVLGSFSEEESQIARIMADNAKHVLWSIMRIGIIRTQNNLHQVKGGPAPRN